MTVILRDPAYRQGLARNGRKTERATDRRRLEREQQERDYEAYVAEESRLIKRSV